MWVWICAAGYMVLLVFPHYLHLVFLLPAQPPLGSQLPVTALRVNSQLIEFKNPSTCSELQTNWNGFMVLS